MRGQLQITRHGHSLVPRSKHILANTVEQSLATSTGVQTSGPALRPQVWQQHWAEQIVQLLLIHPLCKWTSAIFSKLAEVLKMPAEHKSCPRNTSRERDPVILELGRLYDALVELLLRKNIL